MGRADRPAPVLPVAGLLVVAPEWFGAVEEGLSGRLGPFSLCAPSEPFRCTDYYAREMGPRLLRSYAAFTRLIDPAELADLKQEACSLEQALALRAGRPGRRVANIDVGCLDLGRLALATTKDRSHRLYLRDGIFAEVTLAWRDGRFEAQPWTYPDYRSEAARGFFAEARRAYRERLRG